jgi:ATP-dependent helicase/DNAse subunit B
MLFEMSKEEEPMLQDIKQCIVAVLKEQKECDIIKVSELERKYQHVLREARRLMKEIEGQVSRKGVAVKKCDLEGYDILVNAILENYKKVFAGYISALILDLRVKEAESSISNIPSPDMFQ